MLKEIPRYFFKLFKEASLKDIYLILKHVKLKYLPHALGSLADSRPRSVELRNSGFFEILQFIQLMGHRREHTSNSIYRWGYQGESYYASILQFRGLFLEYISGVFNNLYALDWR